MSSDIIIGEVIGSGLSARQEIKAGDWTLVRYGEEQEPRVADLDIAVRLGYEEPRMIRKLIKRMIAQGRLPGEVLQRSTVERYESKPGIWQEREVNSYNLTKKQAMKVATQSKTKSADEFTNEMIDVYDAVQRGLLQPAQPKPASIVDQVARDQIGAVADLIKLLVSEIQEQRRAQTPVTVLPSKPAPSERSALQPSLGLQREPRWFSVIDLSRRWNLSFRQVWDHFRQAGGGHWSRRQASNGHWQIREDVVDKILVQLNYLNQ